MTHMDVIDGYLATNRIKYCRFDDMIGTRHGVTQHIVNGTRELKPRVALRIEQATGLDAADLLCRQAKWQLEQLRERANDIRKATASGNRTEAADGRNQATECGQPGRETDRVLHTGQAHGDGQACVNGCDTGAD